MQSLLVSSVVLLLSCHAMPVCAQAVAADAFASGANEASGKNGMSKFAQRYRWQAFEQSAEEASQAGLVGKAAYLFQAALAEVTVAPHGKYYSRPDRELMLAKTLSEQGRFTQKQLNNLSKAKALYEQALGIYRPQLIRDRACPTLRPRKELVDAEFLVLSYYSDLLRSANEESEAKSLDNEAEQAKASFLAPLPDPSADQKRHPNAQLPDVDFGPYMERLQSRVSYRWSPLRENVSRRVVVIFKIYKNGSVDKLRIDRGSGSKLADMAALKAITDAAPFDPLPPDASDDVDIQFTFDLKFYKNWSDCELADREQDLREQNDRLSVPPRAVKAPTLPKALKASPAKAIEIRAKANF